MTGAALIDQHRRLGREAEDHKRAAGRHRRAARARQGKGCGEAEEHRLHRDQVNDVGVATFDQPSKIAHQPEIGGNIDTFAQQGERFGVEFCDEIPVAAACDNNLPTLVQHPSRDMGAMGLKIAGIIAHIENARRTTSCDIDVIAGIPLQLMLLTVPPQGSCRTRAGMVSILGR